MVEFKMKFIFKNLLCVVYGIISGFCSSTIISLIKTIKSENMTKSEKVMTLLLFLSAKCIGLVSDKSGWKTASELPKPTSDVFAVDLHYYSTTSSIDFLICC